MFCSIPGTNIKVLNKTVEALSKLSDEVNIECQESSLILTALTQIKTSYAKFVFDRTFFLHYEVSKKDDEVMACKVSNRSLMMIFKRRMEKKIETCKIKLDAGSENIAFHLKYKSGITTIHTFHLLDWENTSARCEIDPNSNKFTCRSSVLQNVLNNFKRKDVHIYMDASNDSMIIRNYGSEGSNLKSVHSQIKLHQGEFNSYDVPHGCNFMIPVRGLRSMVTFADSLTSLLLLSFTKGGEPLIITIESDCCNAFCMISTLPQDDSETDSTLQGTVTSVQRNARSDFAEFDDDMDDLLLHVSSAVHQSQEAPRVASRNADDALGNILFDVSNLNEHDRTVRDMNPAMMHVFGRCFEPTFHASQLDFGTVLCRNSDGSDSD